MGNYHPISMQIGTQTKKHMLSSKIIEAVVYTSFQDGADTMLEIQVNAIKWAIHHPISMKIGTQTKTGMLSSKVTKAEAYGKKTPKIKCKKRFRFKRQRCMSAKL
jgi:hypothetical protein